MFLATLERCVTSVVLGLCTFLQVSGLEDAARLLQCKEVYSLPISFVLVVLFTQLAVEERGILGGGVARGEVEVAEARG